MKNHANDELAGVRKDVTEQDCCGKWTYFDARVSAVSCTCNHPAGDEAALDAFIDDYDALFGQRLAG